MATQQQQVTIQKEGRLESAIQAYNQGHFSSYSAAAKAYDITRSTLQRRLIGTQARFGSIARNRLLTLTEEEILVRWILSMDKRGMPLRVAAVRDMANLLIAQHREKADIQLVGQNWVRNLINRHDTLKSKYNRKYDYQRAKCEDPELIQGWFRRVRATIIEYGILEDDIYNFDETGFQMGVIATAKVVTNTDRAGRPRTTQPGNREWVTVIESICVRGFAIPPLVIFDAKVHQSTWYENGLLPYDWSIAVSENGWTNNEIGLIWLKDVFDKYTKNRTIGQYRLLILDGHGSHVTPDFDRFCLDHSIIVLCMPPHSSHLLQPLDVSCFSVLKRSYGKLVEKQMSLGVNHIDKQEFLLLYQQARTEALHEKNIRSGFAATGLVPYDPNRVLSFLHIQFRTPSPEPCSEIQSIWTAKTPRDITQLQNQTELLKQYLKRRTQSPPSPAERAIDQIIKGCQLTMHSAVLLVDQNEKLQAENKRQKRKREQKRTFLTKGGVLSGAEAQALIENGESSRTEVVEAEPSGVRRRAPSKCSLCSSLEHNARTCAKRQRTV
jgi:hypothetical protein